MAFDEESATMSYVEQKGVITLPASTCCWQKCSHVDMTHCGLVRRMKAHGDSALVVAIYGRGFGVAEAQVKKEHA